MSPTARLPIDFRTAIVYQIYPRSFCDSNGDGIGDLNGITSKLDYLQALGVNVVWLSPVYCSPQDDNGYDISDYRAIAPEFGTMADFDAMLHAMHERGIRLVMDLVVNHSSDEHAWFVQARGSRDNPYHDHYIWAEPRVDAQGQRQPPNNWESVFSGSAWEWSEATGEYYLHMFSRKQPDFNWEHPKLRAEVYDIMRFWLDKGVDGFRMDVINMISKPWQADGRLPDAPVVQAGDLQPGMVMTCNGPRLHEFLTEMRREVLDHYPGCITVGEAPLATVEQGRALTHPTEGALNMLFQFEHMDVDVDGGLAAGKWALKSMDLRDLKRTMQRWQDALDGQGWNSLYLSNHDQPRQVSRFGDDSPASRVASAKLLATWLHGLQGTPYVYQGEELGMGNVAFASIEDYQDIETRNYWQVAVEQRGEDPQQVLHRIHVKGRDNARTPMPWRADSPHAGFTQGQPWLALNPHWPEVNAQAATEDPDSVYHHYRRLIALRQQHPIMARGQTQLLLPEHPDLYVVLRTWESQRWLVVCNWSGRDQMVQLPPELAHQRAWLLLGNLSYRLGKADERSDDGAQHLIELQSLWCRPWEAMVIELESV